ncbi:restriction endonuclease [Zoogloea sp.]|uniref:restriction endonuclease n=1 Tax=Zoogloea sp. TaxID=49181 RepID=UPI0035B055A1
MTRKPYRKKRSALADLLNAPWPVSALLALVVYAGLKWALPAYGAGRMYLQPVSIALASFAELAGGGLLLIALLAYLRTAVGTKKAATAGEPVPEPADGAVHARVAHPKRESAFHDSPVIAPTAPEPQFDARPSAWSVELIRDLEWKRFEDVCQRFYASKGIHSATTPLGPDGGIDIRLFQNATETDKGKCTAIVQCKAWGERLVGVKPVRELLGVMTHERIPKAFFMTSGGFTPDAKDIAKANHITLIDGEMFLMMILRLPEDVRQELLNFAIEGDYKVPTCPSCGIKMRVVAGSNGKAEFWGCFNYPRCRQVLGIRRER